MYNNEQGRAEHVPHPERWTLLLSVGTGRLEYLITPDAAVEGGGAAAVTGTVPLATAAPGMEHGEEQISNAVYDTPLLLDDYSRVRVLVASPHFVILPPDTGDDAAERLLRVAFPDGGTDVAVCRLPRCGQVIAFELPRGMKSFLDRTFNTPQLCHQLYPLCEHYYRLNRGSTISRMFLNLREGTMDLVVYRRGELLVANTFEFAAIDDAAYFALHVWQSLHLDQHTDEVQITGRRDSRDELTAAMRRYVKYVMPAIYPAAALRLGGDVERLPFDLVLLSQCE